MPLIIPIDQYKAIVNVLHILLCLVYQSYLKSLLDWLESEQFEFLKVFEFHLLC